jgi:hypothetical protein
MPLYEFERSMEEIELLFPRAKKEVWVRRRVVRVTAVGVRSRRAVGGVVSLWYSEWEIIG